jgi:hypothetical protein
VTLSCPLCLHGGRLRRQLPANREGYPDWHQAQRSAPPRIRRHGLCYGPGWICPSTRSARRCRASSTSLASCRNFTLPPIARISGLPLRASACRLSNRTTNVVAGSNLARSSSPPRIGPWPLCWALHVALHRRLHRARRVEEVLSRPAHRQRVATEAEGDHSHFRRQPDRGHRHLRPYPRGDRARSQNQRRLISPHAG